MERTENSILISIIVLVLLLLGRFLYLRYTLKGPRGSSVFKRETGRDIPLMVLLAVGLMEILLYLIRTLFNDESAAGIFLGLLYLSIIVYLSLRMKKNPDDRLKLIESWKKTYFLVRIFLIILVIVAIVHFCHSFTKLFLINFLNFGRNKYGGSV
jgi:hypothetical protein